MIVFVDGVDGSGKTTLVDRLLDDLAARGRPAVLAPPLWTFLSPVSDPAEFPGWVERTPGIDIGRHLLAAMSRRVDKLCADIAHGIVAPETVVLADRGPKTIQCSARAHAKTGSPSAGSPEPTTASLADHEHDLAEQVTRLGDAHDTAAVELSLDGALDLVLSRLRQIQELTPPYMRYLEAFTDQMATTPPWPDLPTAILRADTPIDTNAKRTLAGIETYVALRAGQKTGS